MAAHKMRQQEQSARRSGPNGAAVGSGENNHETSASDTLFTERRPRTATAATGDGDPEILELDTNIYRDCWVLRRSIPHSIKGPLPCIGY